MSDDLAAIRASLKKITDELREIRDAAEMAASDAGEITDVRREVETLRREVDELGEYLEENIGFAYQVYEWWQAGMPDEGAARLALLGRAERNAQRRDRFARAVLECREADGTWPTQEVVAARLGVTTRSLRDRGIGGWAAIVRRAREFAGEAESAD